MVISTDDITGTTGMSPSIRNDGSPTRRLKDLLYFYEDMYEKVGTPREKLEFQDIRRCLQHRLLIDLIDMGQEKIRPIYLECPWWQKNRKIDEKDPVAYRPLELLCITLTILKMSAKANIDDLSRKGNVTHNFLDDDIDERLRVQAYQEMLHFKIRSSISLDLTQVVSGDFPEGLEWNPCQTVHPEATVYTE